MVIAFRQDNKNYIAVSSNSTVSDTSKKDRVNSDNITTWKIKGREGWYIACSKFSFTTDLIRYMDDMFDEEISFDTLIRYTVPYLKSALSEWGLADDNESEVHIVIANNEHIFAIDRYFCVEEVDDFICHGWNYDIARGAMEFTRGEKPEVRAKEAFHAIDYLRTNDYFPVVFIELETGKKKVWYSYDKSGK